MGVSRDCPNFFGYPLLSQERVKLRTPNFVGTFIGSAHEKCWELQPWAQSGSPEHFQGTHVQGALRVHLCDSSFLVYMAFSQQLGDVSHPCKSGRWYPPRPCPTTTLVPMLCSVYVTSLLLQTYLNRSTVRHHSASTATKIFVPNHARISRFNYVRFGPLPLVDCGERR